MTVRPRTNHDGALKLNVFFTFTPSTKWHNATHSISNHIHCKSLNDLTSACARKLPKTPYLRPINATILLYLADGYICKWHPNPVQMPSQGPLLTSAIRELIYFVLTTRHVPGSAWEIHPSELTFTWKWKTKLDIPQLRFHHTKACRLACLRLRKGCLHFLGDAATHKGLPPSLSG